MNNQIQYMPATHDPAYSMGVNHNQIHVVQQGGRPMAHQMQGNGGRMMISRNMVMHPGAGPRGAPQFAGNMHEYSPQQQMMMVEQPHFVQQGGGGRGRPGPPNHQYTGGHMVQQRGGPPPGMMQQQGGLRMGMVMQQAPQGGQPGQGPQSGMMPMQQQQGGGMSMQQQHQMQQMQQDGSSGSNNIVHVQQGHQQNQLHALLREPTAQQQGMRGVPVSSMQQQQQQQHVQQQQVYAQQGGGPAGAHPPPQYSQYNPGIMSSAPGPVPAMAVSQAGVGGMPPHPSPAGAQHQPYQNASPGVPAGPSPGVPGGPSPGHPASVGGVPSNRSLPDTSPAPGSAPGTTGSGPGSVKEMVDDPAYREKIEQMQKYLEPLKRMLKEKEGENPALENRLKGIVEVIEMREATSMAALGRYFAFLKELLPSPTKPEREVSMCQPLLEAVAQVLKQPRGNESIKRSCLPMWEPPREKKIKRPALPEPSVTETLAAGGAGAGIRPGSAAAEAPSSNPRGVSSTRTATTAASAPTSPFHSVVPCSDGSGSSSAWTTGGRRKLPMSLQREIAFLRPRFRVQIIDPAGCPRTGPSTSFSHNNGNASIAEECAATTTSSGQQQQSPLKLICDIRNNRLPAVPSLKLSVPKTYPFERLSYDPHFRDYDGHEFLEDVRKILCSKLSVIKSQFTLTALLENWESSIQQAYMASAA